MKKERTVIKSWYPKLPNFF